MVKFKNIMRNLLIMDCLLLTVFAGRAQQMGIDSLQVLQDGRALNAFTATGNMVFAGDLLPNIGYGAATASRQVGGFRQPMTAAEKIDLSLATTGFKKVKQLGYYGDLSYKKSDESNLPWSGVYNSADDNPAIWADSSRGNWKRDEIEVTFGISAPELIKKLSVGMQIHYAIGSGARTSDPKPFYRYRNIVLMPGITYQLPKNQLIGITATIGFAKEENELGFFSDNNDNVLLYRIRGYGTFSRTPFVSGERKRIQSDLGANVHHQKKWKDYKLLVAAHVRQRSDEVIEGVASPVVTNYFSGIELGSSIDLFKGNPTAGRSASLKVTSKNGYTDDVIFQAESASSIQQRVLLKVSNWFTRNKSIWQFSVTPIFTFIDNTDYATVTQFTASNLIAVGNASFRHKIGSGMQLYVSIEGGASRLLEAYFINQRPNVITEQLVRPNYLFHTTNYVLANAQVGVVIQSNNRLGHTVSISSVNKLAANVSRSNLQFNYSIIF
ncbi:MAG: DUF6850 family outer membrane beta-barrel protein [Bacteroidota bacterium]|jgi:hypothetical protein